MLHKEAGRAAGGFGRPLAGNLGKGSWGKWAHRGISSVRDDPQLSEGLIKEEGVGILDVPRHSVLRYGVLWHGYAENLAL